MSELDAADESRGTMNLLEVKLCERCAADTDWGIFTGRVVSKVGDFIWFFNAVFNFN